MFNIESLKSLGEPLKTFNYEVFIPSVPGGGDGNQLRFYVDQASIPAIGSEQVPVFAGGHELRYAGRGIYTHDWTIGIRAYENDEALSTLRNWHALQWNRVEGTQVPATEYKTSIFLHMLGGDGSIIHQWKILGAFIANIGEVPLSPDNSNVIIIPVTFGFDNFENISFRQP